MRPKAVLLTPGPIAVSSAGTSVNLRVNYTGGGSYKVVLNDGSVYYNNTVGDNYEGTLVVSPLQSGVYFIKEVSNQCFTGTAEGSVQMNVTNSNQAGILLQPFRVDQDYPGLRCSQDSLQLLFKPFGKFEAGNTYSIQVQKDYGSWVTVATNVQSGKNIKLDPGNYLVRVVSSDPLVFSNSQFVQIAQIPVASLSSGYTQGDDGKPVTGESRFLTINVRGGNSPYRVILSDGSTAFSRTFASDYTETVQINRSVTYTILSVTDGCGAGTIQNNSVTYQMTPVSVTPVVDTGWPAFACAGSKIILPFLVAGAPAKTTTYQLQLARTTGNFTNLGEAVSQSPFTVQLPTDLPAGTYSFRIVAKNPDAMSVLFLLTTGTKPTATLSSRVASEEVQSDNGTTELRVILSGGGVSQSGYQVVFSDGAVRYYNGSEGIHWRDVTLNTSTTYSLKSVMNSCGYGTVSGQVKVTVKPAVALSWSSTGSGYNRVCVDQPTALTYTSRGDFGTTNRFQLSLQSYDGNRVIKLDSSRSVSGSFTVKLPVSLAPGAYQFKVTASDPAITTTSDVYVSAPPQLNLSGNTLINAGQIAYLMVKPVSNLSNESEEIDITLSDGQRFKRNIYSSQQPTYVAVSPAKTTTYTIVSAQNTCGIGQGLGSATVTVNSAGSNRIAVTEIGKYSGTTQLCAGDTVQLTYAVTGTLPAGSSLIAQLSDSTGEKFTDLKTVSTGSSFVRALLPADTPRGNGYRLRVKSSDPAVAGGAFAYPLTVRYRASARFAVSSIIYEAGKAAKAAVSLTGDGPWRYTVATDLSYLDRYALKSPDTVSLQVVSPNVSFKLRSVYNECGIGQVQEPSVLRVELLTATELEEWGIQITPNPTAGMLTVSWTKPVPTAYDIRLIHASGNTLLSRRSRQTQEQLDLATYPAGIYFLQVQVGNRSQTIRLIKQ